MINSYNTIAFLYYPLAKLFFGDQLLNIQVPLLSKTVDAENILLIGGGNGDILPYIFTHTAALNVDYLEASSKMIKLAQRKHGHLAVNFIHSDSLKAVSMNYDLVVVPYVLDIMTKTELEEFINALKPRLAPGAEVQVTDFVASERPMHKVLTFFILLFFRLLTAHPNKKILDVFGPWLQSGFSRKAQMNSRRGLLQSALYTIT